MRINVPVHMFAIEKLLHLRNLALRIESHQVDKVVVQRFAWMRKQTQRMSTRT